MQARLIDHTAALRAFDKHVARGELGARLGYRPSRTLTVFAFLFISIEMPHQIGVIHARQKLVVCQHVELKLAIFAHALNHELAQGRAHLANGTVTRGAHTMSLPSMES